jgi:hypothetical protein
VDEAKEPNKSFQPFQIYNPLEASSKAYRLKPNDISVLNRYGRSLWNRSLAMKDWKDMDEKLEYLEHANKILSDSINVDYDHLFLHSLTSVLLFSDCV